MRRHFEIRMARAGAHEGAEWCLWARRRPVGRPENRAILRRHFEIFRMACVGAHESADAKFGARCVAMRHAKACGSAGAVFDFACGASGLDAGP